MTKIRVYLSGLIGSKRLDKWLRVYIHHRNLYSKGNGELGFFRTLAPLQSLMVLWLFLKSILGDIPHVFLYAGIPMIVASKIVIHWYIGYLWEEHRIFDKEADWTNKRNEAMRVVINGKEKPKRKTRAK